jgi:F0F1-type ATP synthase epsilon subunit
MSERDSSQQWRNLLEEHVAARAALEVANSQVTILAETAGIPIEHLDVECRAESQAREDLARIRRRMDQFDPDHPETLPLG